jgi:hypothetical protein
MLKVIRADEVAPFLQTSAESGGEAAGRRAQAAAAAVNAHAPVGIVLAASDSRENQV